VIETDILEAAFQRLNAFTYSPQPQVLWPGLQSDPPAAGAWLEPGFFPNEPEDLAWNDDGCVNSEGFFQVLVHYRPGQGQPEPVILADAIICHFPKGLALGPVRVNKRGWQSLPVESSDDVFIPVTIPYRGVT
jgi:hypothetical protein